MEELVAKIREAEALALRLKERELKKEIKKPPPPTSKKKEEFPEHGDWLDAFRRNLGALDRRLVVLSLFDGIGGTWAALDRLEVRYKGYSSEINPYAARVLKAKFPNVTHLGDVKDIRRGDIEEEIDLVVGGFPCQDLTSMGKRDGLHGFRSRLFFDMLRILHLFRPRWFLVENVASMTWIDREEISKYLNCLPIEIDSQDLTASKRKRLYWTNIPHPEKLPDVRNHASNLLQHALDDATALEEKIGCVMTCNYYVGGFGQLQRVFDRKDEVLRYVTVTELEKVMGFPAGHTDIDFGNLDDFVPFASEQTPKRKCKLDDKAKTIRWNLIGNSFSVSVISYMLSPLMLPSTWEAHVIYNFSPKFRESECAVLETGELWALYNTRSQPSWYAVILSRSGDRFDTLQSKKKKKGLQIHVCFLELDTGFLAANDDQWSPIRGTGQYNRIDKADLQTSWVTFSHRMTTFKKLGDSYFIYPGENEVWAVFDRDSSRPTLYYVLVLTTEIDWNLVTRTPSGVEGFASRCRLLQQTSASDIFRLTGTEVAFKDLAQFCFKVPYYFKGEGSVFKLELSKTGKYLNHKVGRKRRRKKGGSDEEEEDESESDEMEEQEQGS
ncbi:uncharacterized protein LOC9640092 isoform X1 [Selaginella moellendorffii]|uniref:uncharacterized protein LOC9640092 isoform X1 n=1 Tax=Selaginella moellendorffii TaxID=88036 RepID=UPI000D1C24F5|nr:uncharacterized protein LOC9640092 isoform X1 [Selaginella moellendorffii]|eukprot:XP_024532430.1 uncharacterized protein LOC9640092 isoform X1 [Selaginella moellendorffii]